MNLKAFIRETPDFPEPGVLFRDISPLLSNSDTLQYVIHKMLEGLNLDDIDSFAGIESRGFVLASFLAAKAGKGFIPIRKAGKLPPPVARQSYDLEYGSAILEMHQGQGRIVIVDDVLATGGTLQAAIQVAEKAGYHIQDLRVLINISNLNQFIFRNQKATSLIEY